MMAMFSQILLHKVRKKGGEYGRKGERKEGKEEGCKKDEREEGMNNGRNEKG